MPAHSEPDYAGIVVRLAIGIPIFFVSAFVWLAVFKFLGWDSDLAFRAYKTLVFGPTILIPTWWVIIYCHRGY